MATTWPGPALVIGESEASATELFLQDAILFDEILDDLGLVAVDPAGERGEEQLQWKETGHDADIVLVGRRVVTQAEAVQSSFRTARGSV